MKITGIKTATGDYQRLNKDPYSPHYGRLYVNCDMGYVWCDEFYDLSHSSYTSYSNDAVYDLMVWLNRYAPGLAAENGSFPVTMKTLKRYVESLITWYRVQCEYRHEAYTFEMSLK